jgi:hypothetical protein
MGFDIIRNALFPLKKLIYLNRLIKITNNTSLIGGGVCVLLSLLSFIIPLIFNYQRILLCLIIFFISGAILSLFYIPKEREVIKTADSLGLQEQVLSAYEFRDNNSPVCSALREKAYKVVVGQDFNRSYPLKINNKSLFFALALYFLAISISFIPTDFKNKTIEFNSLKNELLAKVQEMPIEKLKKDETLTKEEKEAILKELQSLSKELEAAKDVADLQKAAKRFENSLYQQDKSAQSMELNKIIQALGNLSATKDIAKDLKDRNTESLKKNMDWLAEKLRNLDEKDRNQLVQQLQKLAKDTEENKELAGSVNELAKNLESNSSDLVQSTKNLSENLSKLVDSDKQTQKSLNKLKSALANNMNKSLSQSSRNSGRSNPDGNDEYSMDYSRDGGNSESDYSEGDESSNDSDSKGQNGQNSQNGQNGQNDQNGQDGQNGENGQNGQNGQGNDGGNGGKDGNNGNNGNNGTGNNGSGAQSGGKGGGGVGEGSSNGDLGINQASPGHSSRAPGEGKVKEFESIYSSKFLGGDSQSSTVKGQKSSSGSSTFNEGEGEVQRGEEISFEQVYGEYREEAMRNLDSSQLPPQYKDKVKNYFEAIDEVSN